MTTTIADFEQQLMQKGMEKGKLEGMQEGMEKGKQEGVQEGMLKKAREFARLMLGDGKPEREVRRYTDLSTEEIRQIKRQIGNSKG